MKTLPAPIIVTDVNELVPIGAWLARYETEFGWGVTHTARAKANDLRVFRDFLMPRLDIKVDPIFAVTHSLLNEFVLERLDVEAASTVQRRLATITHWARWCAASIPSFKPPKVKGPRPVKRPPRWISEEEELKLIAASREVGDCEFERWRTEFIIEALLLTGLRASELLNLFDHQISAEQTYFISVRRKGKKFADIPIPELLRDTLKHYMRARKNFLMRGDFFGRWAERPTLPVVISTHSARWDRPHSYRMSYKTLWRVVKEVSERAGLADISPHICRHTFGRRLYEQTNDLTLVSEAMSHESLTTTMGYCGPSQDNIAVAVNRMAQRYK